MMVDQSELNLVYPMVCHWAGQMASLKAHRKAGRLDAYLVALTEL